MLFNRLQTLIDSQKGGKKLATIGYARVSTTYQRFDSQISKLKAHGCDFIFRERESGTLSKRPILDKAIKQLKPGDIFVIYRLDRLSRGTRYLLELMEFFEKNGIHFISLQDSIDTTTPMGKCFFTIMGAFAEMEAGLIRERVLAGLAATKENGVILGRPINVNNKEKVISLHEEGLSIAHIAREVNCSRSTVYRYLKKETENA